MRKHPIGFVCVLTACFILVRSDIRSRRRAVGGTCSLKDSSGDQTPANLCLFIPAGVDSNGRVQLRFGEQNCQFSIRNCIQDRCYMIWDYSSFMPNDLDMGALQRLEDLNVGHHFCRLYPSVQYVLKESIFVTAANWLFQNCDFKCESYLVAKRRVIDYFPCDLLYRRPFSSY
jgi:hypothetical protein